MQDMNLLVLLAKEKQQAWLKEAEVRGLLRLLRPRAQTVTHKSQIKPVQEETPCPA